MFEQFVKNAVFNILNLPAGSRLGESLSFFIYDIAKIFFLIAIIIFAVSFIRSFFPPEKVKKYLNFRFEILGNIAAAGIGVITPFCTCSAIPLFMGFLESGIPLGVTISYLIAAPMVNEVALGLLWVLFGWKIALLYIGTGLLIAIFSGFLIGRLKLEHLVEDFVFQAKNANAQAPELNARQRAAHAFEYTKGIIKKVWIFIFVGIGVGAVIHGYVPIEIVSKVAGKGNPFAVLAAVAIGVPLYSNAAGTVPIIQALIGKGLPVGTALALMMSIVGLSAPEFLILRRVMKTRLLLILVAIVAAGIVTVGYLFNLFL